MASQGEILPDLECGGTSSEEDGSKDHACGSSKGKKTSSKAHNGALSYNGSIIGESDTNSSDSSSKSSEFVDRRVELLIEGSSGGEECRDLVALLEKRNLSDQRKKHVSKKACKPPRPPKGPSLNASDLKLVKELSELAARKRARMERIKALRKMKEVKRPSTSSTLTAMVITIIFFLVIILQGIFSRSNVDKEFPGSPAPAVATEGLISIQLFNDAPANEMIGPVSLSRDYLERASPREEEGRDIG